MRIGGWTPVPGGPTLVIAEAGVNHNGSVARAGDLVRAAARAGADCVKFQTFKAERVASAAAPKAGYQLETTPALESQLAMLKALELDEAAHRDLVELCGSEGVTFLSTPYSVEDAEFLCSLGVPALKIASGQIAEPDFLAAVASMGVPLLLSTGMATLGEIETAVDIVRRQGNDDVVLLQCTTSYPAAAADVHLRVLTTLQQAFGVVVGYSDHTTTNSSALAAVALGASVIEKHFTLDRALPGPDHRASADPASFAAMVAGIREVESALGSARKHRTGIERDNLIAMRRSVVAARLIPAGTTLTPELLAVKRPGNGIPAARLGEIVGRRTRVDVAADTLLAWTDVE